MVGKGPDIPHYYVDVDNVGGSRKMTELLNRAWPQEDCDVNRAGALSKC